MEILEFLSHLYEAAYVVDENRKILFWNAQCEKITGYTSEEVLGKYCHDNILRHVLTSGQQLCHSGCPLQDTIQTSKVNQARVYLHHKKGYRVPVNVKTLPFYDDLTNKKMAIEIFTDLMDESTLYKENVSLKEKVTIDGLTGVFNKTFIDYQIEVCIKEFANFDTSLGLLFIDVDHFKTFNDKYGHDVGDDVLKSLANTLKHNIRNQDFAGRFGGEEFVILLRDITYEEMRMIAEKIRILVQDSHIFIDAKESVTITVSIGCALLKPEETKLDLVKRADQNMYKAKNTGRNKVCSDND